LPQVIGARPRKDRQGQGVPKDIDPAVADQAWQRFLAASQPLRLAGKLGAIFLQFPPWFPLSRSHKEYIVACAQRSAPDRVCVEFRNHTRMTGDNQEETLGFLAANQLPYVCVDMPQGYRERHRDRAQPVLAPPGLVQRHVIAGPPGIAERTARP
jgi:uncharacterized protein YecE (DUF72 family)